MGGVEKVGGGNIVLLEGVVKVIQRDRLLDNVKVTRNYLRTGLKDAEV